MTADQPQNKIASRLVGVLVALHFGVLFSGIWTPSLENWPALAWTRNIYQIFSAAGGSFGFFSPDIGNQALVEFQINDSNKIFLHNLVSQEISLRLGNMYRIFIDAYGDEKLRRSVAASLSAEVFRRFPEAEKVTMIVSIFRLPSLHEYGEGQRPTTKEVYRVSFTAGGQNVGN